MAKLSIAPGSTSVSLLLFIQDSASTTGGGKTGLAYNTASLACYYVRPGASATSISLITQTVTGVWSSGGFVEVDSTNMPGVYRFDVPNAVLAAGVRSVVVMLKGASGMAPLVLEVDLNAETNVQLWKDSPAPANTGDAYARLGTPSGVSLSADVAAVKAETALIVEDTGTTLPAMLTAIDDFIDTEVAAIKAKTDNLPSDPADQSMIEAAITSATSSLATAANLAIVDTVVDAILADTGTDGVVVATGSKTGYALTTTEHTNIADALLKRDWSSVSGEASRSVINALRFLRNKWSISGTTLTVTKENDATSAWTAILSTDAAADPVTGSDPA